MSAEQIERGEKTGKLRKGEKTYWIPLESNPDMFNEFSQLLGVPSECGFADCFSLDPESLDWIQTKPCHGIVFLAPHSKMKAINAEQERRLRDQSAESTSPEVWYMKQLVGNACGTVAVLHVLANAALQNRFELPADCFLAKFLAACASLDAHSRGLAFETAEGIEAIHHQCAKTGQTETPAADAPVDAHLYELDGGKFGPIDHGPTTVEAFVSDAARVMRSEFIGKLSQDDLFSV